MTLDMNKDTNTPKNIGHYFLVYRPETFLGSIKEFHDCMDKLMGRTRTCGKVDGFDSICISGEIETEREIK